MDFEKQIQNALKALTSALDQLQSQIAGYERTVARLQDIQKTVPADAKVHPFFRFLEAHFAQLPLGEIVGILRRSLSINEFPVLLTLDLRTPLSPAQVIHILQNVMATLASQIKDVEKDIAEAESMSLLRASDQEVLNDEGLPIKEIKENVDDEESRRGVSVVEEVPERTYTMEEIDKMMDEAEAEEQAEQHTSREMAVEDRQDEEEKSSVTAVAGDGLDVGEVNGEELIAKLMDESKKHYNPLEETWDEDEESDQLSEEEEDEFGRTRGYLIPRNLSKMTKQERGVKFASFEKPASPSLNQPEKPIKSALKKSSTSEALPSTAPVASTSKPTTMMMDIVERIPQQVLSFTLPSNGRIPRRKIPKAHVKSVDSKHLDKAINQRRYYLMFHASRPTESSFKAASRL